MFRTRRWPRRSRTTDCRLHRQTESLRVPGESPSPPPRRLDNHRPADLPACARPPRRGLHGGSPGSFQATRRGAGADRFRSRRGGGQGDGEGGAAANPRAQHLLWRTYAVIRTSFPVAGSTTLNWREAVTRLTSSESSGSLSVRSAWTMYRCSLGRREVTTSIVLTSPYRGRSRSYLQSPRIPRPRLILLAACPPKRQGVNSSRGPA